MPYETHQAVFSACMKAITPVHGTGASKASDDQLLAIRTACQRLRSYMTGLLITTSDSVETEETLRAALREMHPDLPYTHPLLIVRDVADIVVTLERLLEDRSRSDEIKILEAHSFCMHLAEPGPHTGIGM